MTTIETKKLAVFYGWPSTVNGSPDVATAVSHYQNYDMIIFGQGIEDPSHGDHTKTVSIINDPVMTTKSVYGYVDATSSFLNIFIAINRWITMGVKGIFFDQFGYDFNVDRVRQKCLIEYVRFKGLHSFVNAWNPDDVFGSVVNATMNPLGLPPSIDGNDWYMAESYQIIVNAYQTESDWRTKSDKLISYKTTFGTKIACVTTTDSSPFDQTKADYSYYSCVLDGFDSWGWGEEFFSASSSQLPYRTRKTIYGTKYTSGIVQNGNVFERNTNVGIHIDTTNHVVSELLD